MKLARKFAAAIVLLLVALPAIGGAIDYTMPFSIDWLSDPIMCWPPGFAAGADHPNAGGYIAGPITTEYWENNGCVSDGARTSLCMWPDGPYGDPWNTRAAPMAISSCDISMTTTSPLAGGTAEIGVASGGASGADVICKTAGVLAAHGHNSFLPGGRKMLGHWDDHMDIYAGCIGLNPDGTPAAMQVHVLIWYYLLPPPPPPGYSPVPLGTQPPWA